MRKRSNTTIECFDDLHAFIDSFGKQTVVFRGVRKESYPLVPKVGRYEKYQERTMLQLFKQQAVPFLPYTPKNDWEWLAIAQHHGLPTRLLDWTHNPLVAAYFAVENEYEGDSVIYAYTHKQFINTTRNSDPFTFAHVARFIPDHISTRCGIRSPACLRARGFLNLPA